MADTEVWVGTWRPHKPIGPIAAMYKSPGPKYELPRTLGQYSLERAGKSLFPSAPAYSLSPRTKSPPKNRTPGPAEYKLPPILGSHTVTKPSAPSFSLKGRSKIGNFYQDLTKTPGPGAYQAPDPSTFKRKAPRYSMTGRNFKPGDKTQKPGPAAHYPEKVHTAPSFSFGVRHSEFITPLIVKDI
uniref:Ciliary microtubule associated protein 1A n=1 Tax=Scleropages formosus TaxID=113540 RepID=A0A8C9TEV9_SCLFO